MLNTLAKPFGWLMLQLYNFTNSYGIAIILFAIIVNIILLPFQMKSKKSMMRTTRLQPKIDEIRTRHAANQQKMNEEMNRLYREEEISPMSGCLWSFLPLPIMLALYYAIRQPLTTIMGISEDLLAEGGAIYEKLVELGYQLSDYTTSSSTVYEQIYQSRFITSNFEEFAGISDKLIPMDFDFLGIIDLSSTPSWTIWSFDFSDSAIWIPAVLLFCIPFISAFMSWASMKISMSMQGNQNAEAAQTTKTMTTMMPFMSLWIGFIMPAALGVYWICNSFIGVTRDVILTLNYRKVLEKEDAERYERNRERYEELERKRLETERKKELGATSQNKSTSKKKLQATQKQKDEERKAALDRADRAARREMLGIELPEKPASQVGNRRYARGRAYVEDRYSRPFEAEEATRLAAEESEYGESIDLDFDAQTEQELYENKADTSDSVQ